MSVKTGKHYAGPVIGAAGLAFLLLLAGSVNQENQIRLSMKAALREYIGDTVKQKLEGAFLPVFSFAESSSSGIWESLLDWQVGEIMPLYRVGQEESAGDGKTQDQMTIEMILLAEAQEGYGETGQEAADEEEPDTESAGAGETLPDQDTLAALLQEENQAAQVIGQEEELSADTAQEQLLEDAFVPHTARQAQVDMAALSDYETLVQSFYTIDKSTMIGSDQLNVEKLSDEDMSISKTDPGPQILIYHTHSQEAFADSVPGDRATSIVGVGDYLTQLLTEKYGYQVLHHDAAYDVPSRDEAYSAALPDIEQVLADYPQIQVIIDLHRDAVAEETHLVTQLDGRPTARFMFFNGLSRTKKTGNITYLYNENLDSNLAFSFQLQKTAMEYYPGLTRKIYLKAYRYNMHLRPRNLLVELGAQNNTVEEAMNACDPLAHILDMVLSGQE